MIQPSINKKGSIVKGTLSLYIYKDTSYPKDNMWIAYCPELDLVGYDYGEEAAKKSFSVVLQEYLEYTIENNTLEEDLLKHGWKKKDGRMEEPSYNEMMKNDKLRSILPLPNYTKCSIPVNA